jgi:hypothetical protein
MRSIDVLMPTAASDYGTAAVEILDQYRAPPPRRAT